MINFFKSFFIDKDKASQENNTYKENSMDESLPEEVDYSLIPDVVIKGNKDGKKLLFMDDILDQFFLYSLDIEDINERYGMNIYDKYCVLESSGEWAAFSVIKEINKGESIDFAVLDITIGKSIKLKGGRYVEYDGVDIAIALTKSNPDCKIIFCSSHPLNRRSPDIHLFIKKWEDSTGKVMDDYYFNKNSDRAKSLYEFLA